MATYVLGGGSCDPKLAKATLTDYTSTGNELIAVTNDAGWLHPIATGLGLEIHPALEPTELEFTSTDTVIAAADTDGLEDILRAGAVVLDLADGLLPLELEEEPTVIPEVPDVPDDLPVVEKMVVEKPVEEPKSAPKKRAPRARTKPTVAPLPPASPKETTPKVSALDVELEAVARPPAEAETTLRSLLPSEESLVRQLIEIKLGQADLGTLYRALDLLREAQ